MHSLALELVYLIAIAFVWSRGTIFRWFRTLGFSSEELTTAPVFVRVWVSLADCPLCSGFWIGVLGHAIYRDTPSIIVWLGHGAIVGTCALAVCAVVRRL